jgi:DNA polymerase III alpha subunit
LWGVFGRETYGITVYQEQVMLCLSITSFTRGGWRFA